MNNNIDNTNLEEKIKVDMSNSNYIKAKKTNKLSIVIIIVAILLGAIFYSKYNYNDFTKSVREKDKTSFSRDASVKYSKVSSYKVENKEYNDAMFYKTIEVKPYTPYKVSCKVKTEGVENENGIYTGGAQIGIKDTVECSESLTGDNDWQELIFMFNSKNRTTVDIDFRLGGYEEKCKGIAWFSDFKIEEGSLDTDNEWNFACFVIKNINVDVENKDKKTNIKLSMTENDMRDIQNNMQNLNDVYRVLSNNQMSAAYDIIEIDEPLTSISYEEENGYYIDPKDVKELIKPYLDKNEYDYIYIAARLGNMNSNENILVSDWIGLGAMDYYQIGFSNIRLPDNENSYIYKYDGRINTFPEEVFVHEYLHTLERNEKEFGNDNIANLHNYEDFGFQKDDIDGVRQWYSAYMQNTIKNKNGTEAGLTKNAYMSKPIHESNFKYSYEMNALKEPRNFIEELASLVKRIKKLFNH